MSIDWITVAAQILNFLVLLWLLKRFLYRPILDGIDAREREIADRLSQASDARVAAETADVDYRARAAQLEGERESMLSAGRDAALTERRTLLAQAHEQLSQERDAQEQARADELRRYTGELQRSGAEALLALLRKALADLADETFEQRLVARTASRFGASVDELKRAAATERVGTVTTREPLGEALRQQLDALFASTLPKVALRYRSDPDRSPGIVLQLGGARLEWSVDRYVDALAEQLGRTLALHGSPGDASRADAD